MPDNMSIRFLNVPEDSRCPASVACIWQGQVTISLNITELFPGFPRVLNLTLDLLPLNSSAKDIDSHITELQQVEPYSVREE
jgi:hypothetical protein